MDTLVRSSKYHPTTFTLEQVPDLAGKVAIVTGGNSGLGYETVRALASKGARVFMAARSEAKARDAIDRLKGATGCDAEFLRLDLQDLNQVKAAADEFLAKQLPLHILVNNADGIESQMGTNHLGHFLFTTTLLPALERAAPSRVVILSSILHEWAPEGGIQFERINDPDAHSAWTRYGQSKLADILFARALDRRVGGRGVFVNAVHPGVVRTGLKQGPQELYGFRGILKPLGDLLALSEYMWSIGPAAGALTQIFVATAPAIDADNIRGQYFEPYCTLGTHSATEYARDDALAERLWEWSEATVGAKLRK
nr:hypothetical protein HK105_001728 [Polyrhizophydium stewartii]